jgi:hypothetical protein
MTTLRKKRDATSLQLLLFVAGIELELLELQSYNLTPELMGSTFNVINTQILLVKAVLFRLLWK